MQGRSIDIVLLKKIECRWCKTIFYLCRSCWRGQAYCCDECRILGKFESCRRANKKYRKTSKGKKVRREAEKRRRKRLASKIKKNKKTVGDRGSSVLSRGGKIPSCRNKSALSSNEHRAEGYNHREKCYFCGSFGEIVSDFPRRGYG